MATDPAFAATIVLGKPRLTATETDLQTPTQAVSVLAAGASGTKIEEINVQAYVSGSLVCTTVAGLVYLFLETGGSYFLFDTVPVTAVTGTTTAAFRATPKTYPNFVIPSGVTLYAANSVAGNNGKLITFAFGGNV